VGRIPEEKLEEVLRATDLVALIQQYVPLKPSGRGFTALCPFHREKTPSFHVNPERQIFKCFGCGIAGSAFRFLQEHEKLEFPEAVELLARRAGIRLETRSAASADSGLPLLTQALDFACSFFAERLRSPAGAGARTYLASRRIPDALAAEFRLGFAPPDGRSLMTAAEKAGLARPVLVRAGLVYDGGNGLPPRDMFRGRLVFPIHDALGRVVAFGARALDDSKPKYLNTPETPLFRKSRLLYGLHLAKPELREDAPLILVEGYTDVMAVRAAGLPNVAAPLGTAFTREHVQLIRRYTQRVVLLFDGDSAGVQAAERAADLLFQEDLDGAVAPLPEGVDPADYVFSGHGEDLRARVADAQGLFAFLTDLARRRFPVATVEGKARAADHLLAHIAKVENPIKRDLYLREAAHALGVDEGRLRARGQRASARGAAAPAAARPAAGGAGAPSPATRAARELLTAVLAAPDLAARAVAEVPLREIEDEGARALLSVIYAEAESGGTLDAAALAARLTDPALEALLADALEDVDVRRARGGEQARFEELYEGAREFWARRRRQADWARIRTEMSAALERGTDEQVESLLRLAPGVRRGDATSPSPVDSTIKDAASRDGGAPRHGPVVGR
jgi:DNA primase